jgi:hypothetical protein
MAAWGKHPPASAEFQRLMLRDLGKLELRYSAKRRFSKFNRDSTIVAYEVVWENRISAFVVSRSKGEEDGQHLYFESPSVYWVHVGSFIEFFSKRGEA